MVLLIELPLEILARVLFCCSSPSYFQLIFTCRTLFNLAAESREVIRKQLRTIPGERPSTLETITPTRELFLTLRRRGAASLQGVNLTADRHDFRFNGAPIEVAASCISSSRNFDLHLGITLKGSSIVRLYQVSDHQLTLSSALEPGPFSHQRAQPLQTVFDNQCNFFVLYRLDEISALEVQPRSADLETDAASLADPHSFTPRGPTIHAPEASETARLEDKISMPISIAAHGGNKIAIAWGTYSLSHRRSCMLLELYPDLDGRKPDSLHADSVWDPVKASHLPRWGLPWPIRKPTDRVTLSKGGTALKCYSSANPASPMYRISKFGAPEIGLVRANQQILQMGADDTTWCYTEDPFFGYHEPPGAPRNRCSRLCRDTRLALGKIRRADSFQINAYIVRSRRHRREHACSPSIDLDQHDLGSSELRPLARLWGFHVVTTNMPRVLAYSRRGTRIALSRWDQILVWPLVPKALADRKLRWKTYPKMYDCRLGVFLVELKPIILKADAVVHQMGFTDNEDELVIITDRGVQIWNLGPTATGRRTTSETQEELEGTGDQQQVERVVPHGIGCGPSGLPQGSGGMVALHRWRYSPVKHENINLYDDNGQDPKVG